MDNAKEKFLSLKEAWKTAEGEERTLIAGQIEQFLSSLDEEEKTQVLAAVHLDIERMRHETQELSIINIRQKIEAILPLISVSSLSRQYFNRTPQWFYQRLNGSIVNGKQARFTNDELRTLRYALTDIASRLRGVSKTI